MIASRRKVERPCFFFLSPVSRFVGFFSPNVVFSHDDVVTFTRYPSYYDYIFFTQRLPAEDVSDGSARVMFGRCSSADATSIADDTLTLSRSSVGGTPVMVVGFFRPGHGTHHGPKNSLIKEATVLGRAYLGGRGGWRRAGGRGRDERRYY